MKHIKEWNWKQIGWRVLQSLIIFIMNSANFAFIVMKMINIGEPVETLGHKTIQLDFVDCLDFKYKIILYILMILGIVGSFLFIKFLYKNKKEKQKIEKEDKFNKNIEKILGGKK